jgi:hypothetical protein
MIENNIEKLSSGLRKIKKRKILFYIFVVLTPFIVKFFNIILNKIFFVPVVIIWIIILAVLGKLVEFSTCPRCGKYFYQKEYKFVSLSWPWSKSCINCGLNISFCSDGVEGEKGKE